MTWEQAVKKGRELIRQNKLKLLTGQSRYTGLPGGSDEAKEQLKTEFEMIKSDPTYRTKGDIEEAMRHDGIDFEDGEWLLLSVKDTLTSTEFTNGYTYSAKDGVGAIILEKAERVKNAGRINWSELSFLQYTQLPNVVPQDLRYIYHNNIFNWDTWDIINDAKKTNDGTKKKVGDTEWDVYRSDSKGDSFAALLGTENGRGAVHLINDHMRELGKKKVSEIHVLEHAMKIVLVDVEEPC